MEKENKELPSIMDLSIDELDVLSREMDKRGNLFEPAPEFETLYKEFYEMKGASLWDMYVVVSQRLSEFRIKLQDDNVEVFREEARDKIYPIMLEEACINELKTAYHNLCNNKREHSETLTYTEWLLGCLKTEIEIRHRFCLSKDAPTWVIREDISNMIERKEARKKLLNFESLSNERIFEIIQFCPRSATLAMESVWTERIRKEYRPLEQLKCADVKNMTLADIDKVQDELNGKIFEVRSLRYSERYFEELKLYTKYLVTYGLNDALSDGMSLRDAQKDLLRQLEDIWISKDDDLPEEPED